MLVLFFNVKAKPAEMTKCERSNTWNYSHVALVGKAMSLDETAASRLMQSLDVDNVVVILCSRNSYSGDDIA